MTVLQKTINYFKNHRFFGEFFSEKAFEQFKKYFIIGVASFVADNLLLFLLTNNVHLWYVYSKAIALVVVFILNFLLNRYWAFQSQMNFGKQMLLSGALFIFNFFASIGMIHFFTDILKIYYMLSNIITVGIVVSWNFIIYKKFIYK